MFSKRALFMVPSPDSRRLESTTLLQRAQACEKGEDHVN
jgi:hypothetical protein